jgi:hypothetical protein
MRAMFARPRQLQDYRLWMGHTRLFFWRVSHNSWRSRRAAASNIYSSGLRLAFIARNVPYPVFIPNTHCTRAGQCRDKGQTTTTNASSLPPTIIITTTPSRSCRPLSARSGDPMARKSCPLRAHVLEAPPFRQLPSSGFSLVRF